MNDPSLDAGTRVNRTTSVAARGSTVVVAFEGSTVAAADFGISNDGGATFTHRRIAAPDGLYFQGEPSVAIGPAGQIYYAFTAGDGINPPYIVLATSTDGGQTFPTISHPSAQVQNGYDSMSRAFVAVDTGASSRYKGSVYVAWTYTFTGYGINVLLIAASTDGVTFLAPVVLNNYTDGVHVSSPAVAIAPNGDVYVAYFDRHQSPAGISVTKSTNGGVSFGALQTAATIQPASLLTGAWGAIADVGPKIAVDGNGVLHVAWAAPSSGATTDRSDVFYARSTDGGTTFAAARKLNDDGTATTQAFPGLAVGDDGSVAVRWADRRGDPASDAVTDVYAALSRDGGVTWGRNVRMSDRGAAWAPAPYAYGPAAHPTYEGIAFAAGTYHIAWSDMRSGSGDVYDATLPVTFDTTSPDVGLAPSATFASILPGTSATFDLTVAGAGGLGGPVALAVDPAPAGLIAALSTTSASPGAVVHLTVSAAPSALPGDYAVGATASAAGVTRGVSVRVGVFDPSRGLAPPANVTRSPGFSTGNVKADPAGVLHAVFDDDSSNVLGTDVFYRRSTDGGATFSAPLKLNPAGTNAGESAVAVDGSGRIYVVWSGQASGDTSPRIYSVRSTDGGATFSSPVAINGTTGYAVLPNVATDGKGTVLVGWFDVSNGTPVVGYSRSTTAGATFTTPTPIFDGQAVFTRPGVGMDSKGNAFLAWTAQSASASTVRFAVSKNGGSTFGGATSVTDSTVLGFAPDVAVGPDDSIGVAYYLRPYSGGVADTRRVAFVRSTDSGSTFSSAVLLSNTTDQAYFPAVAFEAGGGIDVVWEEFDAADMQSDVFVARSTDGGKTFGPPANLSSNAGGSGSAANPVSGLGGPGRASVTIGPAGKVYVAWSDDSAGQADLFLSSFAPVALSDRPPVPVITSPAPGATFEAGASAAFAGSATDPDGDPVTFSWSFGDGGSAAGAAAAHTFGVPGAYTVALTARDPSGASGTTRITVNVTVPSTAVGDVSLLVPVVLEASGVGGSRYTSEVTLVSRAAAATDVVLTYTASAGSGSGYARVRLESGQMRILPGIIDWLRGQSLPIPSDGSSQVGTLLATFRGVSDAGLVSAGARTFTPDPLGSGGTFGLFTPATTGTAGLGETLIGLQQNAAQRSNVAIANAGSLPIVLRVGLVGPNGEDLGALPDVALPPLGWFQYNQPLLGKAASGRAVVTRVSGVSPFASYAVLNDAVTSDGSYVPPLFGEGVLGADRLVPIVLDVAGFGARFRTELTLTNLTAAPLALTLVYTAAAGFGSGSGSVPLVLAAGEQRIVPDAIAFLRGTLPIESDGRNVGGSLLVRAPAGLASTALAVGARTFVPLAPAGSYGLFYPGLTLGECAAATAWVYGLQENAAQRSNLAIVNRGDAGDAITLRITYYGANGAVLGAPVDRALAPGEWAQFGRPLASLGANAGYAKIERIAGASRFAAYGVLNDNVTSDGSYIAMSF